MSACNIIVTYACNNHCPYCFAGCAGAADETRMDFAGFLRVLALLERSLVREVRLLGGEPLLHPEIDRFLVEVYGRACFDSVTLFTSLLAPESALLALDEQRTHLVVNLNNRRTYPIRDYEVVMRNLETVADRGIGLSIGYNIYREEFDYHEVLDLCERFGCRVIRWTVAVPGGSAPTVFLDWDARHRIGERICEFLDDATRRGIRPVMDCPLEPCAFTDNELLRLARSHPELFGELGKCEPVVDIAPDLTASRCFAAAGIERLDIRDVEHTDEITRHFRRTIDRHRRHIAAEACRDCRYREAYRCQGGCVSFNADALAERRRRVDIEASILKTAKSLIRNGDSERAREMLRNAFLRGELITREAVVELGYLDLQRAPGSLDAELWKHELLPHPTGDARLLLLRGLYYRATGEFSSAVTCLRAAISRVKPERRDYIARLISECTNG